ncbi:HIT family protein [Mobilitalea sibirica]|uniref:HIT family protein n=1 Tax=Mobilitalea sibirica TaxID=1462919 RepID=A0A8J7KV20_9FIRM|nr:HIT family protein [Mobilitalea sibirica]MBH1939655.1 HIT family protein [Mobilitalea sibirica]
MKKCIFCNPEMDKNQNIVLSNEHCIFLQQPQEVLIGSGIIVPRKHRETVFDLTIEEWNATYELLQRVKLYLDEKYNPQGYNIGWNVGKVGGQEVFHAHLHVIPRFDKEPFAGKGIRHWIKQPENKHRDI